MNNRYGEPVFRLRPSHLFLFVIWFALVSSLNEYPCLAAGAGSLAIVGYLHVFSLGRTSPLAAFKFVISTAVIGVGAGLPYLIRELQVTALVRTITDVEINYFLVATPCFGMVVAGIVAVIVAIDKRCEWLNHV